MKRLCVLGAGSWGSALAISLSPRFERVTLWARDACRAQSIQQSRQNDRYLPGFRLPENICVTSDLQIAADRADIALLAIPAQHLRSNLEPFSGVCADATSLVSAVKGIEEKTTQRMSQVISTMLPERPVAALSGPTFAKEIAAGEPAAVVIASEDLQFATYIQRAFATPALRLYASDDLIGVEIGAALKNVIAIAAGICRGLGLGSNSVAALITRGLAEITRLALALSAKPRTLSGLAGLGDLVLTATGDLSRNRYVGLQLGQGKRLQDVLAEMSMVAEGVGTCRAAWALAKQTGVDLPIISKMYEILYEGKDPRQAITELMDRPLTTE